ncbi:hypothetical protein SAMN05216243_2858 [Sediminibacillus albus]|uniref:Uncharacterized protein n=1 Tax=Sediminibacillus albus TaxID=407036 RepID=A0A1G9B7H6_9BACI|nr:hypothetical protein SAMN05216243_2858 [Sediminibacillus albus]
MYRKTCHRCLQLSYSSSKLGEWRCPICSHDLSLRKARDPKDPRDRPSPDCQANKLTVRYHQLPDVPPTFSAHI